ncbi:MAG: flagellin, partial [Dehalococcoidia bacterium]|nr:flagellin [Dehalococcoidia bacterium]
MSSIVTNIGALNAQRNLNTTGLKMGKVLEKLSSGYRINRAADDAAGLGISEKMRSQIRGNAQALRNAHDGISMIQTAEGAMDEIHSILQRSRELAVQAANGTMDVAARQSIATELVA